MTAINFVLDNLDFLAEIILFILIYQYITSEKIKLRWYIIIPLIIRFLFVLSPALSYVLGHAFLVVYSLYRNRYGNRLLDIFYGLFPIVIESLVHNLIIYGIALVINRHYLIVLNHFHLNLVIELLVFPVFWLIIKTLKVDFKALNYGFRKSFSKYFLLLIDISMLSYALLLQYITFFVQQSPRGRDWHVYLVVTYALLFLATLVYINATFSERLKEEVLLQKDRQMSDLAHYSQQIEQLYTDLRRFRHDYLNVLSSIKYGIDSKDMAIISDIYDNILEKTKTRIEGKQYEIANLINIKDEAVKGVLASKILEAQGQSITIHLEVSDVFEVSRMELLDFITVLSIFLDNAIEASLDSSATVLSIFLDNAIEASLDSSAKEVNIALISGETKVVIVENTIDQESINTVGIFKLGRSSKGEGRGIGLSTVREILGKYPNCSLSTQSKDYRFKQTLKIEDVV